MSRRHRLSDLLGQHGADREGRAHACEAVGGELGPGSGWVAAEWCAWGVGSVSEHCASGIGAGEGWKATRSRNGDGGQGGVGRVTVSATGGRAGTARCGGGAGGRESGRGDCVSVGRAGQRRRTARGAAHACFCRRGGRGARKRGDMERVVGRMPGALIACWREPWLAVGAAVAEKLLLLRGWCHVPLEPLRWR